MEIKFFKEIKKDESFQWEEISTKECFTKEEIDKKNEDNLRIIKVIFNCLSEYQILSEEQLIELYKDKYPLLVSNQDIENIIHKILKNFRSPFDEKEKNFLRNLFLKTFDEEIFVDEKSYYFNQRMSINIPLFLEEPESFIGNSKNTNKFVIGIVLRKIDPDFLKKCEIEERGQTIDLKTQLLARYQNNRCSISIRDLVYFSERLSRLDQKDRNKFLASLDNWLFPCGNLVDYEDSAEYFKLRKRIKRIILVIFFVAILFYFF